MSGLKSNNRFLTSNVKSNNLATETTLKNIEQELNGGIGVTVANLNDPHDFNLSQYGASATSLGQKAMDASIPVTISNNQSTIPVSLATLTITDVDNTNGGAGQTTPLDVSSIPSNKNTSTSINDHIQQRVSNQSLLVNSTWDIDKEPNIWTEDILADWTITHNPLAHSIEFDLVGATNPSRAELYTKKNYNLNNLPSMLFQSIRVQNSAYTNISGRIHFNFGLVELDSSHQLNNGPAWLFEWSDSTAPLITCSLNNNNATAGVAANQAVWNIDVMDGTGVSGINLNVAQLESVITWVIDINPLGRIRYGIQLSSNKINWVHQFFPEESLNFVHSHTSFNNPITYQFDSNATNNYHCEIFASTLTTQYIGRPLSNQISRTYLDQNGFALAANTIYALTAIKYDTAKTNYANVPVHISTFSLSPQSTSEDYVVALLLNPVINGILAYNVQTNSPVECLGGVAGNTITAGVNEGIRLFSRAISNRGGGTESSILIPDRSISLGKGDTLVLAVYAETAIANMMYSLNWQEGNFY